MPPTQPVQPVAPVQQPATTQLFPPRPVVIQDVKTAVSDVEKDWKSPAFWIHLAVQVSTWIGFISTTNSTIKIGTLSLSATSLFAYLYHLAVVNKTS